LAPLEVAVTDELAGARGGVPVAPQVRELGREAFSPAVGRAATGTRATAAVTDIERLDQDYEEYTVELDGDRRLLMYGWTVPDADVGGDTELALDAGDPDTVHIASPGNWDPDWRHDLLMLLFFPGLALTGTGWVAVKLIPRDVQWLGRVGRMAAARP